MKNKPLNEANIVRKALAMKRKKTTLKSYNGTQKPPIVS